MFSAAFSLLAALSPVVLWIRKGFCKVKLQYLKTVVKITGRHLAGS